MIVILMIKLLKIEFLFIKYIISYIYYYKIIMNDLWDFMMDGNPRTINETHNFIINQQPDKELSYIIDDLLTEAYFNPKQVTGEVALFLLKFAISNLNWQMDWKWTSTRKKVCPEIREYALSMLEKNN